MEVTIIKSDQIENVHTIQIGDKATIETTYSPSSNHGSSADADVTNWVRQITKLYSNKNKKKQPLIIGLVPDRSTYYANGETSTSWYNMDKIKPADYPYELIQLCVGSHCLLYELPYYRNDLAPVKAMRDLLTGDRVVVVGMGMDSLVKKLEKDNKLLIGKAVDLKILAGKDKGLGNNINSLDKLGKVVLGEEWGGVARPRSMRWWSDGNRWARRLSDDKIMFGTLDAFLAYQIGVKLLKDDQQQVADDDDDDE